MLGRALGEAMPLAVSHKQNLAVATTLPPQPPPPADPVHDWLESEALGGVRWTYVLSGMAFFVATVVVASRGRR